MLDNNDRNVIGNSESDVKRNSGSTVLYFMDEWKGLINIYLENIQSSLVLEVSELELV